MARLKAYLIGRSSPWGTVFYSSRSHDPDVSVRDPEHGSRGRARRLWVVLAAALGLLVAVRLVPLGSVFRGGDVVLLSNDPYAYLHLVEHAIEGVPQPRVADGEPLLVWTLVAVSTLFGAVVGAPLVLAVYPVLAAVGTGLVLFWLARTLTDDPRVGVTAVVVLAVTPLYASRTALGFADHHAFDAVWLALTLAALTWLVVRTGAPADRRRAVGGVLGLGVAAQSLAWEGSPLLVVPAGIALALGSLVIVRTEDPVETTRPIVGGFGVGAAVVVAAHLLLGWQSVVVAGTAVTLFGGSLLVLALVAWVDRTGRSWPALLGTGLAIAGVGIVLLRLAGALSVIGSPVLAFEQYLRSLAGTGIGETAPLTATFGLVAGPVVLLGFSLFVGAPAAAWGFLRGWRRLEPGWIVLGVYVAWFLALGFLQRRFAVHLAVPLSVVAGFGFVAAAHWFELVRAPAPLRSREHAEQSLELPGRRRLAILGGMGVVGIGSGSLFSGVICSSLATDRAEYRAAAWMRAYAAERGWQYPRSYVLAPWDNARMYNHFVNGESRSYAHAREYYQEFVFGTDPAEWYEQFEGRVGFVVTRERGDTLSLRIQSTLHDRYGSAGPGGDGVGHYRAVWESDDGSRVVFAVVPGARLSGQAEPDTELSLSTEITLAGSGTTVTYRRRVRTGEDGAFSVRLAQPGSYTVDGADGPLRIEESHVSDGRTVELREQTETVDAPTSS